MKIKSPLTISGWQPFVPLEGCTLHKTCSCWGQRLNSAVHGHKTSKSCDMQQYSLSFLFIISTVSFFLESVKGYKALNIQKYSHKQRPQAGLDWIEQCFTSLPTQYMGDRFLQVKRPNQQYRSTEGTNSTERNLNSLRKRVASFQLS